MTSNDGALNLFIAFKAEASRLVSLLENASYTLAPHIVDDDAAFIHLLTDTPPDLVLAGNTDANEALLKTIFSELRKRNLDIPVILINPETDAQKVVQGLRLGAADVGTLDDDQHLLQIVSRVLYDLEQRRNRVYWKARFKDSEQRSQNLMDSSRDAIALVAEGTYVYLNESYAHLFGYEDSDALMLFPVIDTAQDAFMAQLKPFLKPLSSEDTLPASTMTFQGAKQDSSKFDIDIELSQIEYEGEPTLQFLIGKEKLFNRRADNTAGGTTAVSSDHSAQTPTVDTRGPKPDGVGDIHLQRMFDHINAAIRKASKTHSESLLYYLRIDEFSKLQNERGFQIAEGAARLVAKFINGRLESGYHFDRIAADAFLLMAPNKTPETARKFAEELLQACATEVFEVEDQTVSVQLTTGVSTINEAFERAEVCIDRCLKALAHIDAEESKGGQVQLFEELFPTSMTTLGEDKNIQQYVKQLLDKNLLEMMYQPIVGLQNQEFEYYEAFCRPDVDALPEGIPEDFFAKALKTNIALPLDQWVTLRAFKELRGKLSSHPNTRVFVKISGIALKNEKFLGWLQAALKATKLSPHHVIFQLEEKDVSWAMKDAQALVEELHKAKATVALTHYGLNANTDTLKKINFDFVKPDQTLVAKAAKTTDGAEILSDCLNTAKGEGVKVIVPFVEDASPIPTLWKLGVDYIQGYYIQGPHPAMDYEFTSEE
ncbi:MAG: EAL domain-containing protein [Porticoccaceae bacterium]